MHYAQLISFYYPLDISPNSDYNIPSTISDLLSSDFEIYIIIAMSKTPHIQYLCGFARHGNLINHFKFIVTISSKWYN